jgi:tRNA pseudouridine55 synthase
MTSSSNADISGLLNINKPAGPTSHDVVARLRRLTDQRRIGHAGTLDPMATGVLLVCLGQATRLVEYLMPGRKQYRAIICFGVATDTLDAEGQVTATHNPAGLTETCLRESLPSFLGEIDQIPPIFSAIKQQGRPIYKRARSGQHIDLASRRVTIDALTWVNWQPPHLTLDITCSTGTYIRALARDLGEAVGTGAHLAGLIRTASGDWSLAEAVALAELEADPTTWQNHLLPLDQAITHLPRVTLTEAMTTAVGYGQQIRLDEITPAVELVRAYTPEDEFLAIVRHVEGEEGLWQPEKVFNRVAK